MLRAIFSLGMLPLLLLLLLVLLAAIPSHSAPVPGLSANLTFHDATTHADTNSDLFTFTELDVALLNQTQPISERMSDNARVEVQLAGGLHWNWEGQTFNVSSLEWQNSCGYHVRRPGNIQIVSATAPDLGNPRLLENLPHLFPNRSFVFSADHATMTITLARDSSFDVVNPVTIRLSLGGGCLDPRTISTQSDVSSILFSVQIRIEPTARSKSLMSISGAAVRTTSFEIASGVVSYSIYSAVDLFVLPSSSVYNQAELCPLSIYGTTTTCASVWVSPSQRTLVVALPRVPGFYVGANSVLGSVLLRPQYFVAGAAASSANVSFTVQVDPSPSDLAVNMINFASEFSESQLGRGQLFGGSPLFWFSVVGDAFSFTDQASREAMQTLLFDAVIGNMTCSFLRGFDYVRQDPPDALGFCARARNMLERPTLSADKQRFSVHLKEDVDFDVCESERVQFEIPETVLRATLVSGFLPRSAQRGRAFFTLRPEPGRYTIEMTGAHASAAANAFVNSGVKERWLWDTSQRSVGFPGSSASLSPFQFTVTLRGERWNSDARAAATALARDGFVSGGGCATEPFGWCRYAVELFTGAQGGASFSLSSDLRSLTISVGIAAACSPSGCSDFFRIVANETISVGVPASAVCGVRGPGGQQTGASPFPTTDVSYLGPLPPFRTFVVAAEPSAISSYPPFVHASQIRAAGIRLVVAAQGDRFSATNLASANVVANSLVNVQTISVAEFNPASSSSSSSSPSTQRNGFRSMLSQLVATMTASGIEVVSPSPPAIDGALMNSASPSIPANKRSALLSPCFKGGTDAICSFADLSFDIVTTFWLTRPERVTLTMASSPLWMESGTAPRAPAQASVVIIPEYPTVEAVVLMDSASRTVLYSTFFARLLAPGAGVFAGGSTALTASQFVPASLAASPGTPTTTAPPLFSALNPVLAPDHVFNSHLSAAANLTGFSFFRASFRIRLQQQPYETVDPTAVLYDAESQSVFATNSTLDKLWAAANVSFSFLAASSSSSSSSSFLPAFVTVLSEEQIAAAVKFIEDRFFPKTEAPPPPPDPYAERNKILAIVFGVFFGIVFIIVVIWIGCFFDRKHGCIGCAKRCDEWREERQERQRLAEEERNRKMLLEQDLMAEREEKMKRKRQQQQQQQKQHSPTSAKSPTSSRRKRTAQEEEDDDADDYEMADQQQSPMSSKTEDIDGDDDYFPPTPGGGATPLQPDDYFYNNSLPPESIEISESDFGGGDGGELASSPSKQQQQQQQQKNSKIDFDTKIKPRPGMSIIATVAAEEAERKKQQQQQSGGVDEDEEEEEEEEEQEVWVPKRWSAADAASPKAVSVKRGKSPFARVKDPRATQQQKQPKPKRIRKSKPLPPPLSPMKDEEEPPPKSTAAAAAAKKRAPPPPPSVFTIDVDVDLPSATESAEFVGSAAAASTFDPFMAEFDAAFTPPRNSREVTPKQQQQQQQQQQSSPPIESAAKVNPFAALKNSPSSASRRQHQQQQAPPLPKQSASADSDIEIEMDVAQRSKPPSTPVVEFDDDDDYRPQQKKTQKRSTNPFDDILLDFFDAVPPPSSSPPSSGATEEYSLAAQIDEMILSDPFLGGGAVVQQQQQQQPPKKHDLFVAADALDEMVNSPAPSIPALRNPLQEELVVTHRNSSSSSAPTSRKAAAAAAVPSRTPTECRFDDLDDFSTPSQHQQQQQHQLDLDPLDAFRYGLSAAESRVPVSPLAQQQQQQPQYSPEAAVANTSPDSPTFAASRRTQNNFDSPRRRSSSQEQQQQHNNNNNNVSLLDDDDDAPETAPVPVALKKRVRAFDEQDSFFGAVEDFYSQQHEQEQKRAKEARKPKLPLRIATMTNNPLDDDEMSGSAAAVVVPPSQSSPLYHDAGADAFWDL